MLLHLVRRSFLSWQPCEHSSGERACSCVHAGSFVGLGIHAQYPGWPPAEHVPPCDRGCRSYCWFPMITSQHGYTQRPFRLGVDRQGRTRSGRCSLSGLSTFIPRRSASSGDKGWVQSVSAARCHYRSFYQVLHVFLQIFIASTVEPLKDIWSWLVCSTLQGPRPDI